MGLKRAAILSLTPQLTAIVQQPSLESGQGCSILQGTPTVLTGEEAGTDTTIFDSISIRSSTEIQLLDLGLLMGLYLCFTSGNARTAGCCQKRSAPSR
jgi:hypothetical protein